ncbi:MAG: nicotinate phosphoribosyltransferase [Hydrogenobacter thermophilus]|uniref:nicotinate phosphoribosyltransferase n=1 Tax=Hydrogenobacter thermophilus TaxID=940 RepID=UPI001C7937E5|nr:nicotinate phosphoribosyltransferase [Hydrogenobacter thermophilus]QWK20594.1 MAG: nicotinate phosphoribosyltransferase [Hydrogenobacter thermophilus]
MLSTALITDLYELTMAQSYLENSKVGNAVFSLFVRKLPKNRNFLVSCGLETLIDYLERFRFGDEELKYLKSLGIFKDSFLDYLKEYQFRGSLYAVPEGRIVFQNEPILQVEGPLPDVQILETLVINIIHFQTLSASKAVRSYLVSRGKSLIDFGLRRAHMPEAGLYAARASYIAGFSGTSNLLAGMKFGVPVFGTMAHSFVMVFDEEIEAFRAFARSFPERTVLLIDTYDTIEGAKKAAELMKEGVKVVGVRLDSGNIEELSKAVREIFDREGFRDVKIVVSGGVDEYDIDRWLSAGCPIDAFGVGTKFITSEDAPYLDIAYKLVEYEGKPKYKLSPGKATFPYKRQIIRHYSGGKMLYDQVVKYREGGLVEHVLSNGSLKKPLPALKDIRELLMEELKTLPESLASLEKSDYRVDVESLT